MMEHTFQFGDRLIDTDITRTEILEDGHLFYIYCFLFYWIGFNDNNLLDNTRSLVGAYFLSLIPNQY